MNFGSKLCDECLIEHCPYTPFSEACQLARHVKTEEDKNKEYLDSLDLSSYLSQSNDVATIMDLIKKDYDNNDCLPTELQGHIFNYLTIDDIAYYLANRYEFRVQDQIIHRYTLI